MIDPACEKPDDRMNRKIKDMQILIAVNVRKFRFKGFITSDALLRRLPFGWLTIYGKKVPRSAISFRKPQWKSTWKNSNIKEWAI